ncbi:hypothetical protein CQW23_09884 [Capsicum baccatum]|uniref:Uncharacterized protein n=1 Tax=Capsicum baccatum TaxID=33114 RepID=A0A2G2WY19_CAPBA|nr:hypothetical protein CQW23_09884 [Capsicum baccatum]
MVDPVWDVTILRDAMRELQKEVQDLHWELAAVRMMMFEEIEFCGDLDFFPAPLKEVGVEVVAPQNQIELDSVVDDDYSDEEIDVDEPNFDVYDQFYLLSLYSMHVAAIWGYSY